MNEIVLPEALLDTVDTTRPVVIKTADGRVLGTVGPVFSSEQIAALKAKVRTGPSYSGGQMQAQLKALDAEWARTGGFDHEYMTAFLAKLSETDPDTYGPSR
jgi:hypothetical protein